MDCGFGTTPRVIASQSRCPPYMPSDGIPGQSKSAMTHINDPLNESGFPFWHDQWIPAAATSWAAQATYLESATPDQMRDEGLSPLSAD